MPRARNSVHEILLLALLLNGLTLSAEDRPSTDRTIIPAETDGRAVPAETMWRIYDEVKTPFKYGIVLRGKAGTKVHCPSVFRHESRWYMVYIISHLSTARWGIRVE